MFFNINSRFEYCMNHTQLYHFNVTKFVENLDESIESDSALSITGGINSPWIVDINIIKEFLKKI